MDTTLTVIIDTLKHQPTGTSPSLLAVTFDKLIYPAGLLVIGAAISQISQYAANKRADKLLERANLIKRKEDSAKIAHDLYTSINDIDKYVATEINAILLAPNVKPRIDALYFKLQALEIQFVNQKFRFPYDVAKSIETIILNISEYVRNSYDICIRSDFREDARSDINDSVMLSRMFAENTALKDQAQKRFDEWRKELKNIEVYLKNNFGVIE